MVHGVISAECFILLLLLFFLAVEPREVSPLYMTVNLAVSSFRLPPVVQNVDR